MSAIYKSLDLIRRGCRRHSCRLFHNRLRQQLLRVVRVQEGVVGTAAEVLGAGAGATAPEAAVAYAHHLEGLAGAHRRSVRESEGERHGASALWDMEEGGWDFLQGLI